jgi:bifunctional non-homologous end joining protein LigD
MRIPIPISLNHQSTPFDDPEWVFEIKQDGFRALALIEGGHCWFVSRKNLKFCGLHELATALVGEVQAKMAVLDGELAIPYETGQTPLSGSMKWRKQARYFAFDLLWLNGTDLRALPLLVRKEKLKSILPCRSMYGLYVDHTEGAGTELYRVACELDLEGIVAKRADSPYENQVPAPHWIKIKNPTYRQKERRSDLLKKARPPEEFEHVVAQSDRLLLSETENKYTPANS